MKVEVVVFGGMLDYGKSRRVFLFRFVFKNLFGSFRFGFWKRINWIVKFWVRVFRIFVYVGLDLGKWDEWDSDL